METKIKKIIKTGESERVEFKESTGEWKEIIETISAFSNTKGGVILVGINDEGKPSGFQVGKRTIEDITNKIKENTDPKIFPGITHQRITNHSVIAISVKESPDKPVFAFDRVYKRVGKSNLKLTSNEIRRLALAHKTFFWDKEICEEAKIKDIDPEKVKWFYEKAKYERRMNFNSRFSISDVLNRLDLLKKEKITNAGIPTGGNKMRQV